MFFQEAQQEHNSLAGRSASRISSSTWYQPTVMVLSLLFRLLKDKCLTSTQHLVWQIHKLMKLVDDDLCFLFTLFAVVAVRSAATPQPITGGIVSACVEITNDTACNCKHRSRKLQVNGPCRTPFSVCNRCIIARSLLVRNKSRLQFLYVGAQVESNEAGARVVVSENLPSACLNLPTRQHPGNFRLSANGTVTLSQRNCHVTNRCDQTSIALSARTVIADQDIKALTLGHQNTRQPQTE